MSVWREPHHYDRSIIKVVGNFDFQNEKPSDDHLSNSCPYCSIKLKQLQKAYDCLKCSAPLKLERRPDNSGWLKWNLDGSEHKCQTKKQQQLDVSKEIAAIKAQLLLLVSRLDLIEQEMIEH